MTANPTMSATSITALNAAASQIRAPAEATEQLAADLALALDPVLFARRCGIEPDPWQAGVVRSAAPRMLLNCSRQSGKSTTTSVLRAHTALYKPGSLTLLSPTERQSKELFEEVSDSYRSAGKPVPSAARASTVFRDLNCADCASQAAAQAALRSDPTDPHGLDTDRDGIACESNRSPIDRAPVPR